MLTYNLITTKLLNIDTNLFSINSNLFSINNNNNFSINYNENDKINDLYKIFFISMMNKDNFHKNKFACLNEIMNNFYFSVKQNEKNDFFNIFCKIQKIQD